jgi:hypothetical protein
MAHDVFVSHSAKDKTVSDALVARLEAEGIRCWVAPRDVVPGADWGESIIDAIESSRIMVLIFSASANGSPQIKREIERAVDKGVYTIPFRIEEVQPTKALEYFISSAHWLDAFSQPLGQHLDSLARTIKAILATFRSNAAAQETPPVTQLEKVPVSFPDATHAPPAPASERARSPDAPPPPPPPPPAATPIERPGNFLPPPAGPKGPATTTWKPVIIGIAALVLLGGPIAVGVMVYLLRAPSTPSQVSSSPAPTAVTPAPQTAASPRATNPPQRKSALFENTDGIPSEPESKKLVLDTLLLFNEAVQSKSFKAFYAELGPAWKKETTPRQLMEIFRVFIDKRIDFAEIADVDPTFDAAPVINDDGWLVVKGHYPLEGRDVLFECKYEQAEEEGWKLVAINVQAKPHDR